MFDGSSSILSYSGENNVSIYGIFPPLIQPWRIDVTMGCSSVLESLLPQRHIFPIYFERNVDCPTNNALRKLPTELPLCTPPLVVGYMDKLTAKEEVAASQFGPGSKMPGCST